MTTRLLPLILLLCSIASAQGVAGDPGVGEYVATGGGGGGITHIVDSTMTSHTVDNGTTDSVNTTGANFLVCAVFAYTSGPADNFSDNKSNSWTALTSKSTAANNARETIYYSCNPTVGTGHTFTNTGTGNYTYISCSGFSGVNATCSPGANVAGASNVPNVGGFSSYQFGSVTPASTGDLIVSAIVWGFGQSTATLSVDSGFTKGACYTNNGGVTEGGCLGYLITTGGSAQNPAWTSGGVSGESAGTNASFPKQ